MSSKNPGDPDEITGQSALPTTAVSHIDNLEFLSDVIPKTTTYKQFKEKKAKEAKEGGMEKGQRTLNGTGPPPPQETNGGPAPEETTPQKEEQKQSPTVPRTPVVPVSALIADRTVDHSARQDQDVEMRD
ncbi:hypothetical protein N7512_008270 [Penicillium capsulatum]|nr:hypothetical protein N7512_008270 [Penicillium capsulatum]